MIPDPPAHPAFVESMVQANRAAFRQGRRLTVVVVAVTAALYLWPAVRDLWPGHVPRAESAAGHNSWIDLLASGLVIWIICSCAWRGGGISTGCLAIFYSFGLLFFLVASVVALTFGALQVDHGTGLRLAGLDFKAVGSELAKTLSFLGMGAWFVFSFWVLVVSEDARFYRRTRRSGLTGADTSFSGWHRRRP